MYKFFFPFFVKKAIISTKVGNSLIQTEQYIKENAAIFMPHFTSVKTRIWLVFKKSNKLFQFIVLFALLGVHLHCLNQLQPHSLFVLFS